MSEEVFRKKVTQSEFHSHYLYIPRKSRSKLPNIFPIIVAGIKLRARIDDKNRIYFPLHKIAKPGDIILIKRIPSSETHVVEVQPS